MEWRDLTTRQKIEEILAGLAFAAIMAFAAWVPDLTRL
jgi:hypothetical protein